MADALDAIDSHTVRQSLGGLSEKTLQRLIEQGRFPRPFDVTSQGRMWFRRDVEWYLWGAMVKSRLATKTVVNDGQPPDNQGQVEDDDE